MHNIVNHAYTAGNQHELAGNNRSVSMRGYQGQKSVFRGRVHISRGTRDIA